MAGEWKALPTIQEVDARLRAIDGEVRVLHDERRRLLAYREAAAGLIGMGAASRSRPAPRTGNGADAATARRAARRREVGGTVMAAMGALRSRGAPMDLDEILAALGNPEGLRRRQLYKALHKRVTDGTPVLVFRKGLFWLAGEPLPAGWSHPAGVAWEIGRDAA